MFDFFKSAFFKQEATAKVKEDKGKEVFIKNVIAYSTNIKDKKIAQYASVNLYENDKTKERRYEIHGQPYDSWPSSPAATEVKAGVVAWVKGGPLPNGMTWSTSDPPPKPRKPIPEKKKKEPEAATSNGKVLQFPEKKSA